MRTRPFFMTNKNWYKFDHEKGIAVLTDSAPPEAIKSYKEFYAEIKAREDELDNLVRAIERKYSPSKSDNRV